MLRYRAKHVQRTDISGSAQNGTERNGKQKIYVVSMCRMSRTTIKKIKFTCEI